MDADSPTTTQQNSSLSLSAQLEAILFFRGDPTSLKKLAAYTEKTADEVKTGLEELAQSLKKNGRGITLVWNDDEVMLGTAKEATSLIEKITKDELIRDLGKAGLETLSIVIYKGPISRREIDHIRGVNSTFILRNLLIRGLVEKIASKEDERVYLYGPTISLITHMGLSAINELPEYQSMRETLEAELSTTGTEEK